LDHRHHPHVQVAHALRDFLNGGIQCDRFRIASHDLSRANGIRRLALDRLTPLATPSSPVPRHPSGPGLERLVAPARWKRPTLIAEALADAVGRVVACGVREPPSPRSAPERPIVFPPAWIELLPPPRSAAPAEA